jgi:pyruvate formate lyase activating enzyme
MKPQLSYMKQKCVSCGRCVGACPNGAHKITDSGEHVLDWSLCELCGECAKKCWRDALSIIGSAAETEDVLAEVMRDKPFYDTSGGGMTLSGGEPFMQPEFALELMEKGKKAGLHICVETSGLASESVIKKSMELVDIYLYDYKATGPDHKELIGVDASVPLARLELLLNGCAKVVLRCPMVEGLNDTEEHLRAIAGVWKRHPELLGVEVMAYHNMGRDKGVRVGLAPEEMVERPLTPEATKARWIDALRSYGCSVARIG